MSIVDYLAAVFAGDCTIHVDPPGYTLGEHVRRLEQERQATYRRAMPSRATRRVRQRGE